MTSERRSGGSGGGHGGPPGGGWGGGLHPHNTDPGPGFSNSISNTLSSYDPLAQWMQERAREFQEFDNSLSAPSFRTSLQDPFQFTSLFSPSLHQQTTSVIPRVQQPRSVQMDEKELSPRAQVTIDEDKLQVEFNVQEYKPEELSIKTEDNVLIVLGRKEEKDGGQTFVSKQFEQRFTLPTGAKPENITSALSKDGKLTVTAVRDPPAIKGGKSRPAIDGNSDTQVSNKNDGLPHPRVKYDEDKFQISLDATNYKPEELDVKVEGNNIIIVAKQTLQEAGGTRTRVFEQKFSMPSGVQSDKVTSTLSRDGVLVITAPRGNTHASQSYTKSIENSMNKVMSPSSWDDNRDYNNSSIHESTRSNLLNDSARSNLYDTSRSNLHDTTSRSSILDPSRSSILDATRPSIIDDSGFFDRKGSLFDHENSILAANSESGVSRVEYDNDNYKIHVNVKDFRPEELVVKTVDNTVKVEAKHEEKTSSGNSYSTRSFSQSFTLPRGANPDAISSSLSKEGVLTISAPLPKSLTNIDRERPVPIKFN